MGCIVNGVGEMADADFGYVGGAPGKVSGVYKYHVLRKGERVQWCWDLHRRLPLKRCADTASVLMQTYFLHNRRRNQVDLYVGKELVQRGIPNEEACDALIDLIKANDRWVDKEPAEEEVVAA